MEKIRLFSYKMTHDTGFAPNPFHGFLTLANCKPYMRKTKVIGDWIAGFSSVELNSDKVGEERLVYLMKVTNKVSFSEYWKNPLYKMKKPDLYSSVKIKKVGDNIYKPLKVQAVLPKDFKQMKNLCHFTEIKKIEDLNGENVLISNCFYYFGSNPIWLPENQRPNVPAGPTRDGVITHNSNRAKIFLEFILSNYKVGIINNPHNWTKMFSKQQKSVKKCE